MNSNGFEIFSRGHATLHLAVSVRPSVGHIFEFRSVFALLLLPNRRRLSCRGSGLVTEEQTTPRYESNFQMTQNHIRLIGSEVHSSFPCRIRIFFKTSWPLLNWREIWPSLRIARLQAPPPQIPCTSPRFSIESSLSKASRVK